MRTRLITAALTFAVALTGSAAAAGGPEIYEFEVMGDEALWDCGDFEIRDAAVLRYRVREFYDDDGEFERVLIHGWLDDTFYNATTGTSIEGGTNGFNFTETADAAGHWVHRGLMYHATVPGVGRVLVDAGTFVMDVNGWDGVSDWRETIRWQHGNHQNIDGDFDALCAVLR